MGDKTYSYQFEILSAWLSTDGKVMLRVKLLNPPPTAKYTILDMTWNGHTEQHQKRADEKGITLDEWVQYVNEQIEAERERRIIAAGGIVAKMTWKHNEADWKSISEIFNTFSKGANDEA